MLSVLVDVVDLDRTLDHLAGLIRRPGPAYISLVTAHGVMDALEDPRAQVAFNESDLSVPDGMAIVWILKLAGQRGAGRVYGPSLLREACRRSQAEGWRHCFFGGEDGVAEALAHRLSERYAGLEVVGCFSPPFGDWREREESLWVDRIEASAPDIVWVGLGSPKQDVWMHHNRYRFSGAVLIGVGAAFDFLTGRKRQAPPWVQHSGLEWLFRWVAEPRRLSRRYSRYPFFAVRVLAAALRQRRGA